MRTDKNLCPNLQKPPLPSKIPGYAPAKWLEQKLPNLEIVFIWLFTITIWYVFKKIYLDSSLSRDEKDISVKGYSLVRADHPSNTRRGGVYNYYKQWLRVCTIDIPNLEESISCQVAINNETGYVLVVYRHPSQSLDDFENFLLDFDQVITDTSWSNSAFRLILGNFIVEMAIFPQKQVLIWNQSPLLMGFTSLSHI